MNKLGGPLERWGRSVWEWLTGNRSRLAEKRDRWLIDNRAITIVWKPSCLFVRVGPAAFRLMLDGRHRLPPITLLIGRCVVLPVRRSGRRLGIDGR
jgi:hypothetical protein